MTYEAVLFDLDDTLYPYRPSADAGLAAAFERAQTLGYGFDRETFETVYETGRREAKREVPAGAASHDRFAYFKRGLEIHAGEPRPGDAHALGTAYWDGFCEAMAPFAELRPTLSTLRTAGTGVAVTTNLQTRTQLRKLSELDLDESVDAVVTSEEVGRDKPGSAMFTLPLARVDARASEAVVVGDNPTADVAGGNAVGIETVLFDHAHAHGDGETVDPSLPAAQRPDHYVDSFEGVREVVT